MSAPGRSKTQPHPSGGRYVALLRGVNVGGKNKLPMADLAAIFTEAGCTDVRTYIQSGNVVFSAAPTLAKAIAPNVESALLDRFDIDSRVILRTAAELDAAIAQNPYADAEADEKLLAVAFLAGKPTKKDADAL